MALELRLKLSLSLALAFNHFEGLFSQSLLKPGGKPGIGFQMTELPPEFLRTWSDAARSAVNSPEVKRRIELEGATPVGNSPQEFSKFLSGDINRWREVVKFSGAKPE